MGTHKKAGGSPKLGTLRIENKRRPMKGTHDDGGDAPSPAAARATKSTNVHANEAYMKAVDEVVHKHKKGAKLGKFRLENRRKPFAGKKKDLDAWEIKQLEAVVGSGLDALFGKGGDDDEGSELAATEVADVVDTGSGKVLYQLMVWPYGDGAIVQNRTTTVVSGICQHGLDPVEDLGKAWIRDFARAWLEGSKRLEMWTGHIDFDEEELGEDDEDDE